MDTPVIRQRTRSAKGHPSYFCRGLAVLCGQTYIGGKCVQGEGLVPGGHVF